MTKHTLLAPTSMTHYNTQFSYNGPHSIANNHWQLLGSLFIIHCTNLNINVVKGRLLGPNSAQGNNEHKRVNYQIKPRIKHFFLHNSGYVVATSPIPSSLSLSSCSFLCLAFSIALRTDRLIVAFRIYPVYLLLTCRVKLRTWMKFRMKSW